MATWSANGATLELEIPNSCECNGNLVRPLPITPALLAVMKRPAMKRPAAAPELTGPLTAEEVASALDEMSDMGGKPHSDQEGCRDDANDDDAVATADGSESPAGAAGMDSGDQSTPPSLSTTTKRSVHHAGQPSSSSGWGVLGDREVWMSDWPSGLWLQRRTSLTRCSTLRQVEASGSAHAAAQSNPSPASSIAPWMLTTRNPRRSNCCKSVTPP